MNTSTAMKTRGCSYLGFLFFTVVAGASVLTIDLDRDAIDALVTRADIAGERTAARRELRSLVSNREADINLRAYGLEAILRIASYHSNVDELPFLKELFSQESDQRIRPFAFFAHARLQAERIASEGEQTRRIASFLSASLGRSHLSPVRRWAAEELCSRGAVEYVDEILEVFWSTRRQQALKDAEFCRTRVALLRSHEERFDALRDALTSSFASPELVRRMRYWSLRELGKLEGGEPEAVLLGHVLTRQRERDRGAFMEAILAAKQLVARGHSYADLRSQGVKMPVAVRSGAQTNAEPSR